LVAIDKELHQKLRISNSTKKTVAFRIEVPERNADKFEVKASEMEAR
jgi:hypothetical protein